MHPYSELPPRSYWKSAVAEPGIFGLEDVYPAKFKISPSTAIATAGSCFAQHVAQHLAASGFNFLDVEPPPVMQVEPEPRPITAELAASYGYGMYSARYGNIYTMRQMLQLVQRASGAFAPREDYWEKNGRFFDPFRPTVEPRGYESVDELRACRDNHLARVRELLSQTDVFVFTFGLTEAWISKADGAVYPMCPGTAAGEFSAAEHEFKNFGFREVLQDSLDFISAAREFNPKMRFIFTVSPVPLVATATQQHVLVATIHSKSILRAVAGTLCDERGGLDYFPSYELVSGAPTRGMFFEPNLRSVSTYGVEFVMSHFFRAHPKHSVHRPTGLPTTRDPVCDQLLLESEAS